MNSRTDFFKACDMGDGICRIETSGIVYCYLVVGTKRAMLIDSMTGMGNLRTFAESLTDLPIFLVHTHGHFDHIGGAMDFDEAWLPLAESASLPVQLNAARRHWFERRFYDHRHVHANFTLRNFTPAHRIMWHGINEGQEFDIGGRTLTAYYLPGHTPGSMGFIDSRTGIFFSGDAGSRTTFLFLDNSTTCAEYHESLKRFKKAHAKQVNKWYNAHVYTEMPATILDDLIQCSGDGAEGKVTGPNFRFHDGSTRFVYPINPRWHRSDGRFGNIIVRMNNLA